jgi:hypothetical protein
MRYNLAQMATRAGNRRKLVTFAPITATRAQALALAAIHRRILAPWLGARSRIEAAYGAELVRVLTADSMDDLSRLFSDLADEVQRLVLELTPALREWAFRVEGWHRWRWRNTLLAGVNVDVGYLIGPADAREPIDGVVARNVALVRDISAQAQGRISDAVFRGIQARTPAREVGKQIAEATGMARKRADRVAADQAVKLTSALDAQRQREAGLSVYRWKHSGKLHPRSWHRARNDKLYERDSGREVTFGGGGKKYGDETIPADDAPGIPPFCGCVAQGVLVLDGEVL